jgi:hypothetical protein
MGYYKTAPPCTIVEPHVSASFSPLSPVLHVTAPDAGRWRPPVTQCHRQGPHQPFPTRGCRQTACLHSPPLSALKGNFHIIVALFFTVPFLPLQESHDPPPSLPIASCSTLPLECRWLRQNQGHHRHHWRLPVSFTLPRFSIRFSTVPHSLLATRFYKAIPLSSSPPATIRSRHWWKPHRATVVSALPSPRHSGEPPSFPSCSASSPWRPDAQSAREDAPEPPSCRPSLCRHCNTPNFHYSQ